MKLKPFKNILWNEDRSFIVFYDGGSKMSFLVGPDNYLHDAIFTYLDPYSYYWLTKYKNYFKNV